MEQLNVKTSGFVTFLHSETANVIDIANPYGFSNKMRYYLSCCKKALFLKPTVKDASEVIVSRAPEPDVSPSRFHSTPETRAARDRLLDPTTTIPPDESAIRHAFG